MKMINEFDAYLIREANWIKQVKDIDCMNDKKFIRFAINDFIIDRNLDTNTEIEFVGQLKEYGTTELVRTEAEACWRYLCKSKKE